MCMRISFPPFHFLFQKNLTTCLKMCNPCLLMKGSLWLLLARFNLIGEFGKLDFMCQQNVLFLKAFEKTGQGGGRVVESENGRGYMDPETGLEKSSLFTQDQMCIY